MAFVNSVAKPPRDVRRRQEKFGTTSGLSTAASTTASAPIKSVLCYVTCATVLTFTVLQGALSQTRCTNSPLSSLKILTVTLFITIFIPLLVSFRIRPATTDFTGEASRPSSSQLNPSPGSSRSLAPVGGAGHAARDKPQVKSKDVLMVLGWSWVIKIIFELSQTVCSHSPPPAEIAPMMARTIKAFKNRFSRR